MNILCIGNSFSMDIATYVHQIAESVGLDINIHVLYIPGCPLDRHWKNFVTKDKEYEFYINNKRDTEWYIDLFEGLKHTDYDFITFQQVSGNSGNVDTFFAYIADLMKGVREYTKGQYLLHKTWSYSKEYSHEKYGRNPMNQDWMDEDIKNAYLEVSKRTGVKYIVPSGEAIRLARLKFGDNLNRDGFHLNERGRTLCGILYVYYLTGKYDLDFSNFSPSGYSYDETTPPVSKEEIKTLQEIALDAIKNNKGHNLYE